MAQQQERAKLKPPVGPELGSRPAAEPAVRQALMFSAILANVLAGEKKKNNALKYICLEIVPS